MELIITMVILLIVLFIFGVFYANTFNEIDENTDKQICKASVYGNFGTKLAKKLKIDAKENPPNCKTDLITIEKKENDKAKEIIAESMYDCWDQYGEGTLELFENPNIYCGVCSHITFEDDDLVIDDFGEYLAVKKIPSGEHYKYKDKKIPTYYGYLTGFKTDGSEFLKYNNENQNFIGTIDTSKSKEYSVMFVYVKGKDKWNDFVRKIKYYGGGGATTGGSIALLALGIVSAKVTIPLAVIGITWTYVASKFTQEDFEWAAFVMLRPYDKDTVQNQLGCKYIVTKAV